MGKFYTIFGGNGFVGSEIARQLEGRGDDVARIGRSSWPKEGSDLGEVIFTIGMTADFRKRLVETVELHVLRLHEALSRYKFESFLYLSSARVYDGASATNEEAPLIVRPFETDHIYNISKLAGESLCFALSRANVRVARLSNVYGPGDVSNLFMTAVLREAAATGHVTIGQSPQSEKDYSYVADVARSLIAIVDTGRHRLYNVACGQNFTHREIADLLEANNCRVDFREGGAVLKIPPIEVNRLHDEFGLTLSGPASHIPSLLNAYRNQRDI